MTLKELFPHFIEAKKAVCKISTLGSYRVLFENACNTGIIDGDQDADSFDQKSLQSIYDRSRDKGLAAKTSKDVCTLLKNIFNCCAVLGLCQAKAFPNIVTRRDAQVKPKLKVYQKDEIARLFRSIGDDPQYWTRGIYIAFYTGARIGEVCGIRWEDVDFQESTIHVQRTVERVPNIDGKGTQIIISTPKTPSSNRLLPLGNELKKKLKDWSRVSRPEFYILSNSRKPHEPRVLRNDFIRLCEASGVRYKGFHSIRHTFATMMLENGIDIKTISDILGHSRVEITMDTYSHPSDASKRKAVDKTFKKMKFE